MQSILEILETVPNTELARSWPSSWTIMMRMTSKSMREAIDKARLPTTVSIIWPKYRKNITKINSIFELLNITSLKLNYFDFESDFGFDCEDDSYEDYSNKDYSNKENKFVKIVEEVVNEESIEYEELEYEEDKLLILSDMFSLNEGLIELNLEESELKNNSLKFFKIAFPKLQNLSKLNLKGNNFSCSLEFIEVIMMLPKLVSLNLDFNENFNKKGCVFSGDIYLLEELSLNHCNIACGSYDILKFIEICPRLVSLNLDNNGLNEEWIKRLEQALRHCPNLSHQIILENVII
jgi:hypothetical protein